MKTPSVFLRSADVVLRCSSSLFAVKHPPLFHFGGQRVISSFPAPYNTARNSIIFKINRLNATAMLAFKSICNNPFIPRLATKKKLFSRNINSARTEAQEYEIVKQNVDVLLSVPKEQEKRQ